MQNRHTNRLKYFQEQGITTKKYVMPLIKEAIDFDQDSSILEIGCGEGGNLMPFVDMGCKRIVGVDLAKKQDQKCEGILPGPSILREYRVYC